MSGDQARRHAEAIIRLDRGGMPERKIAKALGLSRNTVREVLEKRKPPK